MPPILRILSGPGAGSDIAFPADGVIACGREEGCTVRTECVQVSRRHCEIRWQDGKALLQDLGSHNGTKVNGQRQATALLQNGDRIELGDLTLALITDSDPEVATPPPPRRRRSRCCCCCCAGIFLVILGVGAAGGWIYWKYPDRIQHWLSQAESLVRPAPPLVVPLFEDLYQAKRYDPSLDLLDPSGAARAEEGSPEWVALSMFKARRENNWPLFRRLIGDLPARLSLARMEETMYRDTLLAAWVTEGKITACRLTHRIQYRDHLLLVVEIQNSRSTERRLLELGRFGKGWKLTDALPAGDPVLHRLRDPAFALP